MLQTANVEFWNQRFDGPLGAWMAPPYSKARALWSDQKELLNSVYNKQMKFKAIFSQCEKASKAMDFQFFGH